MKFKKLANRSASLGKMLLFCCITLGLMTALSTAAAQGNVLTHIKMPMNDTADNNYGELAFALPSQMNVEGDILRVLNYTGGKEVSAPIFLNGSKVTLHLLYPCQAPQILLEPAALKTLLEALDPAMMQVNYSEELLGINGKPAIWGQVGSQEFVAYQPTNQTAAIIVMDIALTAATKVDFLGNLSITINEGTTPLTPGFCPDITVAHATATAQNNATPNLVTDNEVTPAENLANRRAQMALDREAALAKVKKLQEDMRKK
ncbi:MAG: hypothetical protein NTU95_08830 [Methanothrix sp.]|nr:hypothetical protein [Methanothrix sp.]